MPASEDFDIVGFRNTVSADAHFQIMTPIVRHRRQHTHHALLSDDIHDYQHVPAPISIKELDRLAMRGDATPLDRASSVRAFPGAVILFISDEFKQHLQTFGKIKGKWSETRVPVPVPKGHAPHERVLWGTVVEREDAVQQGNEWAKLFYEKAQPLLREHIIMEGAFDKAKAAEERSLLLMGLHAAPYPEIKQRLFVAKALSFRLSGNEDAVALVSKSARNRFPEIKTHEDFLANVETLRRNLMLSAPQAPAEQAVLVS